MVLTIGDLILAAERAEYPRTLLNNLREIIEQVIRNGQQAGDIRTGVPAQDLAMMPFAMGQGRAVRQSAT